MKVPITIDQAVWERTTFTVEIEDGLTGDDLTEALQTAVDNYEYASDSYQTSILDEPVYGVNKTSTAELPDGSEIEF